MSFRLNSFELIYVDRSPTEHWIKTPFDGNDDFMASSTGFSAATQSGHLHSKTQIYRILNNLLSNPTNYVLDYPFLHRKVQRLFGLLRSFLKFFLIHHNRWLKQSNSSTKKKQRQMRIINMKLNSSFVDLKSNQLWFEHWFVDSHRKYTLQSEYFDSSGISWKQFHPELSRP